MKEYPNRSADYPFLRTRRKPVEAPPRKLDSVPRRTDSKPGGTPPSALDVLSRPRAAKPVRTFVRPVRKVMDEGLPKLNTPIFRGSIEMSLKNPVIRLDYRQSAIGSLVIKNAQAFAWEDSKFLSGLEVYGKEGSSKIFPPHYGNRSLLGFEDADVIVNLRHGHHIRRAVFASSSNDLFVRLYDGSEIFIPTDSGKNVLVLYRVGHEFEMRLEKIDTTDLLGAFGIIPSQVSR